MLDILTLILPILYTISVIIFTVAAVCIFLDDNRATPPKVLLYIMIWPIMIFNQKLLSNFTKLFELED